MADLNEFTVKKLRELARKHVGTGHTKLKTKADLLAALSKVPQALKEALVDLGAKAAPVRQAVQAMKAQVLAKDEEQTPTVGGTAKPQGVAARAAAPAPKRQDRKNGGTLAAPAQVIRFEPRPRRAAEPLPAEPVSEGFFVARVAGEQEARRHRMVEDLAPPQVAAPTPSDSEHLGEVAWTYRDDASVALARDPRTLFFCWDFHSETVRAAAEGVRDPKAVLRLYEHGRQVRQLDFALEARSFYLHDLAPGGTYHVEAYFLGSDGHARRIGRPSNAVTLPPDGPSADTSVRFLRIPWGFPLLRLKELEAGASGGAERRYLTWTRVRLPHSAGFRDQSQEWVEQEGYLTSDRSHLGASERRYEGASERLVRGAAATSHSENLP